MFLSLNNMLAIVPTRPAVAGAHPATVAPPLEWVMLFGFLAAIAAIYWKIHGGQTRLQCGVSSLCLAALALYAFLVGAWPIGLVEAVSAVMALRPVPVRGPCAVTFSTQDRIARLFGHQNPSSPHHLLPPDHDGGDALAARNN